MNNVDPEILTYKKCVWKIVHTNGAYIQILMCLINVSSYA